jgi:hypothetical protein
LSSVFSIFFQQILSFFLAQKFLDKKTSQKNVKKKKQRFNKTRITAYNIKEDKD